MEDPETGDGLWLIVDNPNVKFGQRERSKFRQDAKQQNIHADFDRSLTINGQPVVGALAYLTEIKPGRKKVKGNLRDRAKPLAKHIAPGGEHHEGTVLSSINLGGLP